ncbi:MAG: PspC domain-containing protein [Tissierellia bacterium]|nr:PspC domain-containing protein [Tissierellia bacterium]
MNNKLYRSRNDKVFLGTLGGIAEYFNIDSTIVRIAFLLFFFIGSPGPILIFMYLLSPFFITLRPRDAQWNDFSNTQDPYSNNYRYNKSDESSSNDKTEYYNFDDFEDSKRKNTYEQNTSTNSPNHTKSVIGVLLVLIGLYQLAKRYMPNIFYQFDEIFRHIKPIMWPAIFIILGIYLLVSEILKND